MSIKIITIKQLEVSVDIMVAASNIFSENSLEHSLKRGDEEKDVLSLEVHYNKDDHEPFIM